MFYEQNVAVITVIPNSMRATAWRGANPFCVQSSPSVTPSLTPTISTTPSVTPSISISPSVPSTPSITPSTSTTPSVTPSVTPSISTTPSISVTPTTTTTPSVTPSVTPSNTPPSGQLFVYAKYINSGDELGYTLNGGSYLGIGEITTTSCTYVAVINGVSNGDQFVFSTLLSKAISGNTSDCPVSAGSCTYSYTFTGTGANYVYITIDGSQAC